jgi:high-affinity iron transporter
MVYLFDVPAYFILLRETLEVTIILAVLLGFIDKLVPEKDVAMRRSLKRQIWIGTGAGLALSLIIGIIFIVVFYTVAKNLWEENGAAWEGSFALIASVVITFMALSMARVQQWRKKWERKLEDATESYLRKHETGNKWALILLPFTVICREAVETFVFIAGIGFDRPASDLPIPAILGLLTGFIVGWILYKGSHKVSINVFFTATSAFLLFIAAGLFSYSIHEFQEATGTEEVQIWNASCCNEKTNEFWGIMKTIFGWRAKATVGTTAGYFLYWACVLVAISIMYYVGKRKDEKELDKEQDPEIGEKSDLRDLDKTNNV